MLEIVGIIDVYDERDFTLEVWVENVFPSNISWLFFYLYSPPKRVYNMSIWVSIPRRIIFGSLKICLFVCLYPRHLLESSDILYSYPVFDRKFTVRSRYIVQACIAHASFMHQWCTCTVHKMNGWHLHCCRPGFGKNLPESSPPIFSRKKSSPPFFVEKSLRPHNFFRKKLLAPLFISLKNSLTKSHENHSYVFVVMNTLESYRQQWFLAGIGGFSRLNPICNGVKFRSHTRGGADSAPPAGNCTRWSISTKTGHD